MVLSGNYSSTEQVNFIQQLLAYSLITGTKDPSKVTDIELTAHMIVVNNRRDSVFLPPLVAKPKKGKSQTVAPTLPKSQGPEASGALSKKRNNLNLERNIKLTSTGLPSILNEGTRPSKPLLEGTATYPKELGGNKQPLDRDITSTISNEGTTKTTPRPEGSLGDKDSGGNIPSANIEPIYNPITDLSRTGEPSYEGEPDTQSMLLTYADVQAIHLSEDEAQESDEEEQHEEAAVSYADLKAFVDQYYDKNIAYRDQTDKLVEASMSSLDRSSTTISDLYKGLSVVTQLLKEISNIVKDDPAINQKLNEAPETFVRISSNVTEVLSLVKRFDFLALLSTVKSIQDHAFKQEEASTAWMKTSTNMAWNLGSRMFGVELSQTTLKREISSLRKDTSEIKSMMTEMYATFQGYSSLAPSGSVTPTLALTDIQANVEGENANTSATEEPPSHTEGETKEPRLAIPIS
ncbi:hypothetical protein Tco_0621741 [Tanacetum coccineum]